MSVYSETYSVLYHDTDPRNVLRPGSIARIMQETANHHMRERKPSYEDYFAMGKTYILSRMNFEISLDLKPYDDLVSQTWLGKDKAATFLRCYRILRGGKEAVRAYSEWAVVDMNTGRLVRTSEIENDHYEHDAVPEMRIPIRFLIPRAGDWQETHPHYVSYADVDLNGHMNNTHYPDMIWSRIPDVDQCRVTSFSLRFRSEAPLGSTIEIQRLRADSVIEDGKGADTTYYFKTAANGKPNLDAIMNVSHQL